MLDIILLFIYRCVCVCVRVASELFLLNRLDCCSSGGGFRHSDGFRGHLRRSTGGDFFNFLTGCVRVGLGACWLMACRILEC